MIGFKDRLDDIRAKRFWWSTIDVNNYSWNNIMDLVDSHPKDKYDWNREKQRLALNQFHGRESAPQFAKDIVEEMRQVFSEPAPRKEKYEKGPPQITNIAFCGFGQFSGSYPRHKDSMDVFLVQVINDCKITVGYTEEPRNQDEIRIMKPGDVLWIPRGTWHKLEPTVSRVTFSFGFESDPDCDPALWI